MSPGWKSSWVGQHRHASQYWCLYQRRYLEGRGEQNETCLQVIVAGALAEAVDQVDPDNAGAQDGEANEERQANMHANIEPFMHVDTFLTMCQKEWAQKAQNGQ